MSASKRTMDKPAFKIISDHSKAKQLQHIQENKVDVINIQELDHTALIASLLETCVSSAFNFIGTTLCKYIGTKLRTRIYNDNFTYQISYISSEIISSCYETKKK